MNRSKMLARVEEKKEKWDFIVIGGGATGTGVALDAASRGYSVLLLEQGDFGQGTSSRSTKLIHGGVRYLRQGNVGLVLEALKERGILRRNAPHLVHNLPFIVPNYDWWEGPFYGVGLKIYDMLAGKEGFGKSEFLSKDETVEHIPTVETRGLNGGVIYFDGQFDDARLVINLTRTAAEQGATVLNYMKVLRLTKRSHVVDGVVAVDAETDKEYELKARAVINATGAFTDRIRNMDERGIKPLISPSQGVHIVLDSSFLPGDSAIMVPHTDDGRVLFTIPWHDRVIVGTTETPLKDISSEPKPFPDEIAFLISHAARYLSKDPGESDVLSMFAGIRPLVGSGDVAKTSVLSRDHVLIISRSGLITITGGKWTTYRKMAVDTIDQAILVGQLDFKPCVTETLQIHGYHKHAEQFGDLQIYGSDGPDILDLIHENPNYGEKLHPELKPVVGEVIWAVRQEMARNIVDFLSRRRRCLLLNAKASIEMAPKVAQWMAKELGKSKKWRKIQVDEFRRLANDYLPSSQRQMN
jgi:glycerol-3-phosphate dehydrogenase